MEFRYVLFDFSNTFFFIRWLAWPAGPTGPASLTGPAGPASRAGQLFCFRHFARPSVFRLCPDHIIYSSWLNQVSEITWLHVIQQAHCTRTTMISARVLSDLRLSLGYTPWEVSQATFPCLGHLNSGASRGFLILPISVGAKPP